MTKKRISWYVPGKVVVAKDKMRRFIGKRSRYTYTLTARYGDIEFPAELSPRKMLEMGVFEGKYINDCTNEFPMEWYTNAKLSDAPDPSINFFGVKSRSSFAQWLANGWIPAADDDEDARGWFQWYCRYYIGRRDPAADEVQIKRWRAFKRHKAQIVADIGRKHRDGKRVSKMAHRPKQRQALLQWAYDPLNM